MRVSSARKLKVVHLEPIVIQDGCPTKQRFVDIIDDPESLLPSEINHIRHCAKCTMLVIQAAKVE